MTTPSTNSPPWNRNVKVIVTIIALLLLAIGVYTFSSVVAYLVYASIMAYLLNPIIKLITDLTPLKRNHSILITYLIFVLLIVGAVIAIGVAAVDQVTALRTEFPTYVEATGAWFDNITAQESIEIGPFSFDPEPLRTTDYGQLADDLLAAAQNSISSILSRGGDVVGGAARFTIATVGLVTTFVLVLLISIYLSLDAPRLENLIGDFADLPGYREDAERLFRDFGRIWRSYLRGQFNLAFIMFFIVWIVLLVLGVNNPLALGMLSGIMEFLPVVGPFIGTVAAVAVAIFQEGSWIGLSGWQFAVVVGIVMLILQQIENSILVPRIVGDALNLHALVILLAVFMGTSVAGILGAILAAPVAASLKLIGIYAWHKMFDHDPFPEPENTDPPPDNVIIARIKEALIMLSPASRMTQPEEEELAENKPDQIA